MIISDKKVKGVEKHTDSAKGTNFSLKQELKTIDNPGKKDDNNKYDNCYFHYIKNSIDSSL